MREFFRVYRKKNVFLLLILVILNFGLFYMSYSPERQITLTGTELRDYIADYHEYIGGITEKSDSLSILAGLGSGYNAEKIKKTSQMYSSVDEERVAEGENRGLVLFLQYRTSDLFVLVFLSVIACDMLKERKKGLVNAVRSTAHGRGRLYIYRVCTLAVSAVLVCALIYGSNLAASCMMFGNPGVSRAVQSLPEFMQCPYNITVFQFIAGMLMMKAVTVFILSLVFFILLSLFGTGTAYAVSVIAAAAEVLMYSLFSPVSSMNILRYCNLYTILKYDDFYSECFFLNIFGRAVPALNVVYAASAVLMLAAIVYGYIIHSRFYVSGADRTGKIRDLAERTAEKFSFQKSLPGWEMYKILIKQGGIVFLAAAFLIAYSSSVKYSYVYQPDYAVAFEQLKFHGEMTEEKLESVRNTIDNVNKKRDNLTERYYDALHMKKTYFYETRIINALTALEKVEKERELYMKMESDMSALMDYSGRTGRSMNFIQQYPYEFYLRDDKTTSDRASLLILIGIIGAVSGIFAYDRQSNMRYSMRSSYRGRWKTGLSKIIPVCLLCAAFAVAVHLIQFYLVREIIPFGHFQNTDEPVQAIVIRSGFPLNITISQYIVLLFAVRALAAVFVGIVCCLISRFSPDTATAMGISVFVLAVPAVLSQLIPELNFLNVLHLLSGAGL